MTFLMSPQQKLNFKWLVAVGTLASFFTVVVQTHTHLGNLGTACNMILGSAAVQVFFINLSVNEAIAN